MRDAFWHVVGLQDIELIFNVATPLFLICVDNWCYCDGFPSVDIVCCSFTW